MNFMPPVSVRQVGDPRWRRFIVMDGAGHCWTGRGWSDDRADAKRYLRESDAMRVGLRVHEGDKAPQIFKASVEVSVSRGAWTVEELVKYLKRWGRFVLLRNHETREIRVTIHWGALEEDDRPE
jgi:hypothetical protein